LSGFKTFIVKVANRCNIDCDYCYVFNLKDQSSRHLPARISLEVAQVAASRIAEHAEKHAIGNIHVVLHGGEPLLVGPRHFESLLSTFLDRIKDITEVHFELQTNGTLITSAWLDIFEEYNVTVGVSLDGPQVANDIHRLSRSGKSSAAAAERGIGLLHSRRNLFKGLLAVIDLANEPDEVYDYLASFEPPIIDFNLPHATHDEPPSRRDPTIPEYGIWLSRVYDSWINSKQIHSVRLLEDIVALSCGVRGAIESLGLAPSDIVVIESNGTIESVDTLRAVKEQESWLGLDLFVNSFDDAMHHPKIVMRRTSKADLSMKCQNCALVEVCGGGYMPHRYSTINGYRNPSVYCDDLMYLIRHIQDHLDRVRWEPNLRAVDRGPLAKLGQRSGTRLRGREL
jgi:radical SAM/SPASM domain FxsB family protein